jgi:uncharacterized membrane protein
MDKKEFLNVLRQTLDGEVSADVTQQNIRYYDQYIGSQSPEEESRIIEMLGDPRLIAKTIIESEKAAKQKGRYHGAPEDSGYSRSYTDREEEFRQKQGNQGRKVFHTNLTWWQKLTAVLILLIIVIVLVFIGRVIIGFLFAFAVPILLVLLLFALFRKRN